jgi:hypothetical protein
MKDKLLWPSYFLLHSFSSQIFVGFPQLFSDFSGMCGGESSWRHRIKWDLKLAKWPMLRCLNSLIVDLTWITDVRHVIVGGGAVNEGRNASLQLQKIRSRDRPGRGGWRGAGRTLRFAPGVSVAREPSPRIAALAFSPGGLGRMGARDWSGRGGMTCDNERWRPTPTCIPSRRRVVAGWPRAS